MRKINSKCTSEKLNWIMKRVVEMKWPDSVSNSNFESIPNEKTLDEVMS